MHAMTEDASRPGDTWREALRHSAVPQAIIDNVGLPVEREDMVLPPRPMEVTAQMVTFTRRRLYVGPERDPEIEEYLRTREPQEHRVIALWCPGAAAG